MLKSLVTIRTFETCSIRWERGSEWTGYDRADAEAVIASAAERGDVGLLVVKTWDVEIVPEFSHLYRPGISERTVEVAR